MFGLLAVGLGAFGAHGLKESISEELFSAYHTGVEYQFLHAVVLLILALICSDSRGTEVFRFAAYAMVAGILLFSGSLYVLALTDLRYLGPLPIGVITPVGGSVLIMAWLLMLVGSLKKPNKDPSEGTD